MVRTYLHVKHIVFICIGQIKSSCTGNRLVVLDTRRFAETTLECNVERQSRADREKQQLEFQFEGSGSRKVDFKA